MNATALAVKVNGLLDDFGNNLTYYAPVTAMTYSVEGDVVSTWQATTAGSYWVEADVSKRNEFTELGMFHLKANEAIMKNNLTIHLRGKVVSNGINWEITQINPVRIKDVLLLNIVTLKNILP